METKNQIVPRNEGFEVSGSQKTLFIPNAEIHLIGCRNCVWKLNSQCPYGLKDDEFIEIIEFDEKSEFNKTKTFRINSYSGVAQSGEKSSVFAETKIGQNGEISKGGDYSPNPKPPIISEGICPEMLEFVGSMAGKNDTFVSVLEKFLNYKVRLQESADYADFKQVETRIKILERELESNKSNYSNEQFMERLDRLRMDKNAAKMWWTKLNQYAGFSLMKIADRESKAHETPKLAGIHSSGTINFNIKAESPSLANPEKKQIEEK